MIRKIGFLAGALLVLGGCAGTPPATPPAADVPAASALDANGQPQQIVAQPAVQPTPVHCLQETGSRIRRAGVDCQTANGDIVDRSDLENGPDTNLGSAIHHAGTGSH